jgi:hypothetical protein
MGRFSLMGRPEESRACAARGGRVREMGLRAKIEEDETAFFYFFQKQSLT